MRGVILNGERDVSVEDRDDPRIEEPTDAIIRLSATCICGSDLWPYRGEVGDEPAPMGHEYCGIVEEVGSKITHLRAGDRVVVPFNISCGYCWMCARGLQSQCETTQQREQGTLVVRLALGGPEGQSAIERCREALQAFAIAQGAQPIQVLGEAGCTVPRGRSGKACRVMLGG